MLHQSKVYAYRTVAKTPLFTVDIQLPANKQEDFSGPPIPEDNSNSPFIATLNTFGIASCTIASYAYAPHGPAIVVRLTGRKDDLVEALKVVNCYDMPDACFQQVEVDQPTVRLSMQPNTLTRGR